MQAPKRSAHNATQQHMKMKMKMKMKLIMKPLFRCTLLLAATALAAFNSSAATRIWDGGGASDLWEASANWSNNLAVANGDLVVFPGGAARLTSMNRSSAGITNVSALRFTGGGYTLFSSPLRLNSGLINANTAVSPNTINAVLRPLTNQTWSVDGRTSL